MKTYIIQLPDTFKPPTTGGTCPDCCQFIDADEDLCNPDECPFKGEQEVKQEDPPTDLWEQHKAMIKLAQDHGLHLAANWAVNMSGKTFSEAEPLAVLADRKGWMITMIKRHWNEGGRICPGEMVWSIHMCEWPNDEMIIKEKTWLHCFKTYSEAEAKARQYLMGLPDREAK